MPFDPKLIPADEAPLTANGEINLPDELAALAEQLRDDSAHLVAVYPASPAVGRQQPATASRKNQYAAAATVAGTTLAAFLAGLVILWQGGKPLPVTTGSAPQPPELVSTSAPPVTTISLTELSSPELEALLDLIQRQPETVSVSF